MSGIETARTPFLENRQLSQRAEPTIELHRLSASSREDRQLFAEVLRSFVASAEPIAGLSNLKRLFDAETAACVHEISQGVMGAALNLIKAAIQLTVEAGRGHLTCDDLGSRRRPVLRRAGTAPSQSVPGRLQGAAVADSNEPFGRRL